MNKQKLVILQAYKNEAVLTHFCHYEKVSLNEATILFQDLLGWMWLADKRKSEGKKSSLFGPLLALDKLWHSFILHTQSYVQFCEDYFGAYFHHNVELPGSEPILSSEELHEYLSDCFDFLGEAWIRRYFSLHE